MLQALGAVVQYLKPSGSSLHGLQNGQGWISWLKELVPIVLSCAVWGPLILQKKIGIQVRQSQPCRCHQQRFIKGTYGHASLAVPLVFLSFLRSQP